MSTRHSPGPWHIVDRAVEDCAWNEIRDVNDEFVCALGEYSYDKGNARLIAAAPEMLEALKHAEALIMAKCDPEHPTLAVVRAAIAKAEEKE